jgi:hypothetical protein
MTAIHCTQAELAAALAALPELFDAEGHIVDPKHVATGVVDRLYVGQKDAAPPAVVVATPTIMDGLVLRWYRNADVAKYGSDSALLSAGRSGVMVNGGSYLHDVPGAWLSDANRAVEMLQHGQRERARELATHERPFSGEIVEIKR